MTTVISDVPRTSPTAAATIARPAAKAVTRPDASTRATETSLDDQANSASPTANPFASNASAARRTVSPGVIVSAEGDTATTAGGPRATTVSRARPVTPADVAVISASPAETPVTTPSPSTTATSVSPDAHANSAPPTGCPFASEASAESRTVPAIGSVSAAGDTVTTSASWATVTAAVAEAEPAVAVTIAVPLATAVTRPEELFTPATETSLLLHATDVPAITCPFWSRTAAESCAVAPKAGSVTVSGVTVTVVGVGVAVVGPDGPSGCGSTAPSPHAYAHAAIGSAMTLRMIVRRWRSRRRMGFSTWWRDRGSPRHPIPIAIGTPPGLITT